VSKAADHYTRRAERLDVTPSRDGMV